MINAIAGLVLGYLFFQMVNMNQSQDSAPQEEQEEQEEDDSIPSPQQPIPETITTLNGVYFEGENYLYEVSVNGESRGYVIGNSTASSFRTQNTSSGALTFTYEGTTYQNVINYTYQEGVDFIDSQTNTEEDPTDPVQPQPEPPQEDDDGFDYNEPDFDFGLGQNGNQFTNTFSAGNM